jgi:hypothetical protein
VQLIPPGSAPRGETSDSVSLRGCRRSEGGPADANDPRLAHALVLEAVDCLDQACKLVAPEPPETLRRHARELTSLAERIVANAPADARCNAHR